MMIMGRSKEVLELFCQLSPQCAFTDVAARDIEPCCIEEFRLLGNHIFFAHDLCLAPEKCGPPWTRGGALRRGQPDAGRTITCSERPSSQELAENSDHVVDISSDSDEAR